MKKFVSMILVAMMVVAVCGLSRSAAAVDSKSDLLEITPESGKTLSYADVDESVKISAADALAVAHDNNVLGDLTDSTKLTELFQKDITASSKPLTITFTASGLANTVKLLVFHYEGGAWKLVGSGDAPTLEVPFNDLSPVAVFSADTTNPAPTGDNSHVFLWGSLMAVAALGAVGLGIFAKRKKQ